MERVRGMTGQRLLAVVGALWACWLAVTIGMAGLTRNTNPQLALQFAANDARALSVIADAMLLDNLTPQQLTAAANLSRAALRRDPTNVAALRIVGLSMREADQARVFTLSEKLSRRDLGTQVWMIENAVSRNDVRNALYHYDVALRTSQAAQPLLFPVLSAASSDAELASEISRTLARKPDWAVVFLFALVNDAPSPDRLIEIMRASRQAGVPLPPALLENLTRRTLRDERFDLTRAAYFVAGGRDPAIGTRVVNGDFAREPGLLPFDWEFASDPQVFASRSTDDRGKDFRLSVQASDGVLGEAVKQMVMLPAGTYRLTVSAGNIPPAKAARVSLRITCAGKAETLIGDAVLPPAPASGIVSTTRFGVPAACTAQWIAVRVSTQTDSDGVDAWIDSIAIDRVSA